MPVDTYVNTGQSAGEEASSTGEGRHLTFEESVITHPSHSDGFVDGGDPVIVGDQIVGVAFKGASAVTDMISIDAEGIWWLTVEGANDLGDVAITRGDQIFIDRSACTLSVRSNSVTQLPFGYALSGVASGADTLIAVKVHWDPSPVSDDRIMGLAADPLVVATTRYGRQTIAILTDGQSEGLCGYHEGHIAGTQAGNIYNFGSWINVDAGATLGAGYITTPYEGGVYAGEAQDGRIVFAGQHHAILAGAPTSLHAWRLNIAAAAGPITALIAAANPTTVAYAAGEAGQGVAGTIPIADIVGIGVVYVDVHTASA